MDSAAIIHSFISAFAIADYKTMESLLADNLHSYVTNANGGADEVIGSKHFMDRIKSSNYEGVKPKITTTQLVKVADKEVLVMIEVQANSNGEQLHNHAAFLFHLNEQLKITKMWMVEALPQYSDEFWKKAST